MCVRGPSKSVGVSSIPIILWVYQDVIMNDEQQRQQHLMFQQQQQQQQVMLNFSRRNRVILQNQSAIDMPLETVQYLALWQRKEALNAEITEVRNQIKGLTPAVTPFLQAVPGHKIELKDMTPEERAMFGAQGKLRYVKRVTKAATCTKKMLYDSMVEYTMSSGNNKVTLALAQEYARKVVMFTWAKMPDTESWELERTKPRPKDAAAGSGGLGGSRKRRDADSIMGGGSSSSAAAATPSSSGASAGSGGMMGADDDDGGDTRSDGGGSALGE